MIHVPARTHAKTCSRKEITVQKNSAVALVRGDLTIVPTTVSTNSSAVITACHQRRPDRYGATKTSKKACEAEKRKPWPTADTQFGV